MPEIASEASGMEKRSARTRAQLIEAAIEVIGAVGYEGATTRALAKAASSTLSAIPYHFGGKRELYLAAATTIADYARERFAEAMAILDSDKAEEMPARFEEALTLILRVMISDDQPYAWTSFIARCAHDNDEAFAVIHEQAIAPVVDRLVISAASFTERPQSDEALRLHVSAIITAIISVRFLRAVIERSMGWEDMDQDRVSKIERMVRDLCRSDFLNVRLSRQQST